MKSCEKLAFCNFYKCVTFLLHSRYIPVTLLLYHRTFIEDIQRNAIFPEFVPWRKCWILDVLPNILTSSCCRRIKLLPFNLSWHDKSNDGGFIILPKIGFDLDWFSNLGLKTVKTDSKTDTEPAGTNLILDELYH